MSLDIASARDAILELFTTAWNAQTNPTPLFYWDKPHDPPQDGEYARITVRHNLGFDGAIGGTCFTRQGIITVQIFTKFGEGLSRSDVLTKVALDAFQGKSTCGGVWFRNVRPNEVGQNGDFFQVNVIADFEYEEVI